MSPIYLQRDDYVKGLIRLLSIGLRVLTLLEFQVRRGLAGQQEQLSGLYPGNPKRATARPTAEQLLAAFCEITLLLINSAKEFPLNQKKLLKDLQLLQLNPLIESISAKLAAGSRPEASSLTIDITEADTFSLGVFLDNGRSPSVGSFRRGLKLEENNFLGFGDRLTLSYTNTDGSDAGDLNYDFPLNRQNGSLNFAAGINDTEVVESPFDRLDIVGDSYYLDFSVRQPIVFKPTQEFSLGVTFSYQNSQTKLLGDAFTGKTLTSCRDVSPTRLYPIKQYSLHRVYPRCNQTWRLPKRERISTNSCLFILMMDNYR